VIVLCSGKTFFETIAVDGQMPGCDWENVALHVLFTSNPMFVISGFSPVGLKRLEMLLHARDELLQLSVALRSLR
jgi:hypothetical protein